MRLVWLLAALFVSGVLAFLQHIALADFLYWRYPWFDTPMHFLGGLAVGLFLAGVLGRRFKPLWFLMVLVAVFIGWEVFEYIIGTDRESNYVFDTALDLLMDTVGGLVPYTLARFTIWRSV